MVELFTRPAKERYSLNVLHNLILKHHIAGAPFQSTEFFLPWGLAMAAFRWPVWQQCGMLGDEPGVDSGSSFSWSKSHLCAYREETSSKVSYRLCEGRMWQCWDNAQPDWTSGIPHCGGQVLKWHKACSSANRALLFLMMAKIGIFCNGRKSWWSNGTA